MPEIASDKLASVSLNQYVIYGKPGCFMVNFASLHNSLHQVSGFKSEGDVHAWIEETKFLAGTSYR